MPGAFGRMSEDANWSFPESDLGVLPNEEERSGPVRTLLLGALSCGLAGLLWAVDVGRVFPFPDLQSLDWQKPASRGLLLRPDTGSVPAPTNDPSLPSSPSGNPVIGGEPQELYTDPNGQTPEGAPLVRSRRPNLSTPLENAEVLWPVWNSAKLASDADLTRELQALAAVPMGEGNIGVEGAAFFPVYLMALVPPEPASVPSEVSASAQIQISEVQQARDPGAEIDSNPHDGAPRFEISTSIPLPLPAPPLAQVPSSESPRVVAPQRLQHAERAAKSFGAAVRCRALTLRAQLGEELSGADLAYLRRGCE